MSTSHRNYTSIPVVESLLVLQPNISCHLVHENLSVVTGSVKGSSGALAQASHSSVVNLCIVMGKMNQCTKSLLDFGCGLEVSNEYSSGFATEEQTLFPVRVANHRHCHNTFSVLFAGDTLTGCAVPCLDGAIQRTTQHKVSGRASELDQPGNGVRVTRSVAVVARTIWYVIVVVRRGHADAMLAWGFGFCHVPYPNRSVCAARPQHGPDIHESGDFPCVSDNVLFQHKSTFGIRRRWWLKGPQLDRSVLGTTYDLLSLHHNQMFHRCRVCVGNQWLHVKLEWRIVRAGQVPSMDHSNGDFWK
mmetsp:Transcript_18279/g.45405  ORF Transcript_18279/g.45405 Transcript_18279/m.45405 type:complete len:303 (-) Transcript_18279:654-1562(-)